MIKIKEEEAIIAQCTPQGSGAIALIRLSGTDVLDIIDKIAKLPSGKKIKEVPSHSVHFGYVIDDNSNIIDQVMFIVMHGPKTFTGQDTVEVTAHNNPFIVHEIIAQAIKHGARMAQEGEFTKRAFINNKIDLVQAEAINELIHANTQLALKKSLQQLEGSFSHWISEIEKELTTTLAWCEASFEFLEEGQEFAGQIKNNLERIIVELESLKKTFNQQQQIRQGIRIALIGSVNAGKSSIFNALLNQKRSIVTEIAGTTRDVIEAGVYRNNNYWTLIDTAGLRQTEDIIEKEGIKRSFEEAQKADIILLVFDGSRQLKDEEQKVYGELLKKYNNKVILIYNKADLSLAKNFLIEQVDIKFSSINKQGLVELEHLIEDKIAKLFTGMESPFLLNKRQYNLILGLEQKIKALLEMLKGTPQYELISYHLTDALEYISELTGKTVSEAGMDAVFREFCVGK
ncbi:MAG: tRNA uridine-5-carboxymethylaminomethyl(34) synthesis GTPase MnmE [Candidatus Amoebophilus sp.]